MRELVALTVAATVGSGATASAASLGLDERLTQDALHTGERSVTSEAFGDEWRVENRAGETLTVVTPFHRLAMAARHAAFKNQPLKPAEQDRLLREQRGRLVLVAQLKGPREDFARLYAPELVVGPQTVKAAFVQNERTAGPREGGGYVAHCVYGFPVKDITGTSRVTLVVRDGDGREASTFTFDLSTMR